MEQCHKCEWLTSGPWIRNECEVWCGAGRPNEYVWAGRNDCPCFIKIHEIEVDDEINSHLLSSKSPNQLSLKKELKNWIKKNIPKTVITKKYFSGGYNLRFYNANDAILFKMRWL